MSNPPQDPGSVPRLRARARVSGTVRPEVADAIGQVERSLGDVARWERVLADPEADAAAAPPAPFPVPVAPGVPLVDDDLAFSIDQAQPSPLLAEFAPPGTEPAGPEVVLPAARTVTPPPPGPTPPAPPLDDDLARRRRNGRILSWAGVMILVGVAALWLIPDRSSDDGDDGDLPALEVTTSSTTRASLVPPIEPTTVPTTAPTVVVDTTAPAPATTATTRSRSVTTTTTRAPAPPPTSGVTTSTLGQPAGPCPAGCPTGPRPGEQTTTTAGGLDLGL